MILNASHGRAAISWPDGVLDFCPSAAGDAEALRLLARAGFVQPTEHGSGTPAWRWSSDDAVSDRALLALIAAFDLELEIGMAADKTAWIAIAVPKPTDEEAGGEAFSGTGFAPADAIRSCLGEFAEFQSWLYRPGDSDRRCERSALGDQAIDPWLVLGFAPEQRARWRDFNADWPGYDSIPDPAAFQGAIDWSRVTALGAGGDGWLPSQLCFGRYGDDWRSDSNGCAAGQTAGHAIAHALLELVERDATGIWWHARISRPGLPPSSLQDEQLAKAMTARTDMRQRVSLLDLTHDLGIPVVATALTDTDNNLLSLGFGCHVDWMRAARAAYLEMCQMELAVALVRRRVRQAGAAVDPDDRRLLDWIARANVESLPHLRPDERLTSCRAPAAGPDDEGDATALVLERLQRAKLQAYVADLRRQDIGIAAVRAFVPGLCHYKPRLGHRRLIEVPRALRWRDASFGIQDLSELPLLI
jgi:ribosomal protein S12 methylthiotransferase accessory factor